MRLLFCIYRKVMTVIGTRLLNFRSLVVRHLIKWGWLPKEKKLNYDKFEVSFEDDFNGRKLDTNTWMTHYYWGHAHSDYEHQFYSSEAFSLKESVLTINVEQRKVKGWYVKEGKRASKTFDVTSGLIHTGESFKQRYGRFEIRCKVPLETGFQPAFWLINPMSYPPEIDVMDFSEGDNTKLHVGHVYGDADANNTCTSKKVITPLEVDGEWTTYTLDWTPHKLIWYVNGYEVFRLQNKGIPQTPMYIAINMAIGNAAIDKASGKKMKIDWVKVYKFR
jgi:beta-glucanase (GH16 family)